MRSWFCYDCENVTYVCRKESYIDKNGGEIVYRLCSACDTNLQTDLPTNYYTSISNGLKKKIISFNKEIKSKKKYEL